MFLGTCDVRPTGRTRYRVIRSWGRERLVLQVEEAGLVTRLIGPHPDTDHEAWWRDATTADLTTTESVPLSGHGGAA